MCGIGGVVQLAHEPLPDLATRLRLINEVQRHRGPDGHAWWAHPRGHVGLAHRRLSIIDLDSGGQPMGDDAGNWIAYNGEIYNYLELRAELGPENFTTTSDTEVILRAYQRWGTDCVRYLRGMFAFALWDETRQRLVCARDRFGIKPFNYTVVGQILYFASEVKALLPFMPAIETDLDALKDYLAFQFCLSGKTLFKGIHELLPGHILMIQNGVVRTERYWEVFYHLDLDHTAKYFEEQLRALIEDSVRMHLRSDVPVGAYLSGGLDSGAVAALASRQTAEPFLAFTGKFTLGPEYDESAYARLIAERQGMHLHEVAITVDDFIENLRRVIYHLDFPVAGPGSFPQYIVSRLAAQHRKVVLGGQGGDEVFGGYTRYLIAYFEQCIKAAIDGTARNGNFVVTYESIIPNLVALRQYKPMLQEFWRDGLFEEMDRRYFRLVNRASSLDREVRWGLLGNYSPYETFRQIFYGNNVRRESYFDLMTHFDFKTLLPALLQIEDRVSMAHGLESRVPLLDHPIVEFAATIPANIKFTNGTMKHIFRQTVAPYLPRPILDRQDKMGFPTPIAEWAAGPARAFVQDILSSRAALQREWVDNRLVSERVGKEPKFGRNLWGLLSLEIWQQEYHDRAGAFRAMLSDMAGAGPA